MFLSNQPSKSARKRSIGLILLFPLLTAGCAVAPGYHTPQEVDGVVIAPISGDLIAGMASDPVATEPKSVELPPSSPAQPYLIGPYDILSINVWDYPSLDYVSADGLGETRAAGYVVAEDGTIFFPFAGRVRVAGKTPAQVRRILAASLTGTILDPQIDVRVAEYRSRRIYVAGEVETPGVQPISNEPVTLLDALSMAGGPTEDADLANASLSRGERVYPIDLYAMLRDGDLRRNIALQNGDILHVPDNSERKIYVIGEVTTPTALVMTNDRMSLTEAIHEVGGISAITSNPAQIFVIRGNPTAPEVYQLNARNPVALVLGDHFPLRPRDVVYVDSSNLTRWSRVINQILPTASFFGSPDVFAE